MRDTDRQRPARPAARPAAVAMLAPALAGTLLIGPLGGMPAAAAPVVASGSAPASISASITGPISGPTPGPAPVLTQPAAGERATRAPARVRLVFPRMLDPLACTVTVAGPGGAAGLGPAWVSGRSIVAVLAAGLPFGAYTVTWRVRLRDGAASAGSYRFTVVASGGSASPAPSPSPAAVPSGGVVSGAASPAGGVVSGAASPAGAGPGAWVAPAVSGLLLVGLVGAGLLAFGAAPRRPRRSGPASGSPVAPTAPADGTAPTCWTTPPMPDGPDPAMAATLPIRVPGSTAAQRIPVSAPAPATPAWWLPRRESGEVTESATATRREPDPPRR